MNGAYMVRLYPKGFLRLDGPFAYASWVNDAQSATPMSYALAHSWAAVYAAEVARFGA